MPRVNTGRVSVSQEGKTKGKQRKARVRRREAPTIAGPPAPKPKPVTPAAPVPSGDQVDRNQAARKVQIAKSKSLSPDRQDTKRSPEQVKRDAQVVAKNVRAARYKVVTERSAGSGTRAIMNELSGHGVIADVVHKLSDRVTQNTTTLPGAAKNLSSAADSGSSRFVARTAKDFVNLPANAIPAISQPVFGAVEAVKSGGKDTKRLRKIASDIDAHDPVYNLGAAAVEAAGGDSKAARKRLKVAEDSAVEHPGFAVAEVAGVRGGASRGAGAVARTGVAGKRVKAAVSTQRAPKTLEGTNLEVPREWSRDPMRKAAQVNRSKSTLLNPDGDKVGVKDINRRVDERVSITGTDPLPLVAEMGHTVNGKLRVFNSPKLAARAAAEQERKTGLPFSQVEHHGKIALVPAQALKRLEEHRKALPETTVGKALEVTNDAFRRTVLSTSSSWAAGNLVEGVGRAAINRAGPRSYLTGRKLVRQVKALDPAKAEELIARVADGGHYSLAEKLQVKQVAHHFADTSLEPVANALHKFMRAPGPKQAAKVWHVYTEGVFAGTRKLEQQFQLAHLGREVRKSELMNGHLLKLSQKAIEQAADGLKNTNEQVRFARAVQDAYGKYSSWSPSARHIMAAYSPFVAWMASAVKFVAWTLPREHPVLVGLTAAAENATREWRKEHGLDMWAEGSVPGFLEGSIPSGGGFIRASRFTPMGAFGNLGDTAASQVNPLFSGPIMALKGLTWNGSRIRTESGIEGDKQVANVKAALAEFVDATIPIVSQAKRIGDKGAGALNPFAVTGGEKKATDKDVATLAAQIMKVPAGKRTGKAWDKLSADYDAAVLSVRRQAIEAAAKKAGVEPPRNKDGTIKVTRPASTGTTGGFDFSGGSGRVKVPGAEFDFGS